MEVCEEMQKLRDWLNENGIEWLDASDDYTNVFLDEWNIWMCRTRFMINNREISVINGHGSYGGYGVLTMKNHGFLEVMGLFKQVRGYLTAEEIIAEIKRQFE